MLALLSDPAILIGLWVLLAFVLAAFPSTDNHWRRAYILMAIGCPLLIWITWEHGFTYGVIGLIAGVSILRWPVYFLWQRIKGKRTR